MPLVAASPQLAGKRGAKIADISTVAKLRQMLLAAKSVAYLGEQRSPQSKSGILETCDCMTWRRKSPAVAGAFTKCQVLFLRGPR